MSAVKIYSVSRFKNDLLVLSDAYRQQYKEKGDDADLEVSLMLRTFADMLDVMIQNFGIDEKGVI